MVRRYLVSRKLTSSVKREKKIEHYMSNNHDEGSRIETDRLVRYVWDWHHDARVLTH